MPPGRKSRRLRRASGWWAGELDVLGEPRVVTDGPERVDPIGLACGLDSVVFALADSRTGCASSQREPAIELKAHHRPAAPGSRPDRV
jgi:hypothetical protein